MTAGMSVDFTVKPVAFEGTLSIHEHKDPTSGQVLAVFRMADTRVVPPKPLLDP